MADESLPSEGVERLEEVVEAFHGGQQVSKEGGAGSSTRVHGRKANEIQRKVFSSDRSSFRVPVAISSY